MAAGGHGDTAGGRANLRERGENRQNELEVRAGRGALWCEPVEAFGEAPFHQIEKQPLGVVNLQTDLESGTGFFPGAWGLIGRWIFAEGVFPCAWWFV